MVRRKEIELLKHPQRQSDLISFKNRGKLIFPGEMMVEICKEVEKGVGANETAMLNEKKKYLL